MTNNPMYGRSHYRPQSCRYGCCVPDYAGRSKAAKRAIKRRIRHLELKAERGVTMAESDDE